MLSQEGDIFLEKHNKIEFCKIYNLIFAGNDFVKKIEESVLKYEFMNPISVVALKCFGHGKFSTTKKSIMIKGLWIVPRMVFC